MWLPPCQGAAAGWQMMLPAQSGSSSAQTVGDHAPVNERTRKRSAAGGWSEAEVCAEELAAAPERLPLRWRDCCSAGDRGTEEDAAAKKKPLRKEHHREARRAALVSALWQRRGTAPSGSPQSCAGDYGLVPQRRSRCEGSAIGKMRGDSIGKMRGASIGRRQSTAIGRRQSTAIGKMRGDTIGRQENTYAVRRMSRPLMPM